MENLSKLHSKARKLKTLATRGEGGEKENAQKKYLDFIKEHKINDSDIDSNMNQREFREAKDSDECDIINTIILSINPYAKFSTSNNVITVELDDEDFLESKDKIDYFIKLWRLEKNALRTAFTIKHNEYFKPDNYSLNKWRENKTAKNQNFEKNEFNNIQSKIQDFKVEYNSNPKQVLSKVINNEDDSYKTVFNYDRSLQMAKLLITSNYSRKVKKQ